MKEKISLQALLNRYEINPWEKVAVVCSDGIIYVNGVSSPNVSKFGFNHEYFDRIIVFKTHTRGELLGNG